MARYKDKYGRPYVDINEKKLNADFRPYKTLDIDYVILAKKIAQDYLDGKPINLDDLKYVRQYAAGDIDHLKGDFIVSIYANEGFKRWTQGKSIDITEKMAYRIFQHHRNKDGMSVTEFCKENRLTRTKYYRVVNCNVSNKDDKEWLEGIKDTVFNSAEG